MRELLSEKHLSKWNAAPPAPVVPRSTPVVFVHVPKTAGTAFAHYLDRWFRSPFVVPWDDVDAGFRRFLDAYGEHDVARGHIEHRHVELCLEDPRPFWLATFIRDPVERAISNYTFCCSEKHPTHERFQRAFPTFDRYVDWGGMSSNYLAKTLVGGVSSAEELIERALDIYQFIGVSELFNASTMLFALACGVEFRPPREKVNAAEQRRPSGIEISESAIQRLREANDLDVPFYEHVVGLYREQMENLVSAALRRERGWLGRWRRRRR